MSLAQLERIRWHRNALIAIGVDADGSRRITRLDLNPSGPTITKAATLHTALPGGPQAWATISGDDLLYLEGASNAPSGEIGEEARPRASGARHLPHPLTVTYCFGFARYAFDAASSRSGVTLSGSMRTMR